MQIRGLSLTFILAGLLAACGCDQPASPGGGSSFFQRYTLSGAVTETTSTGAAPVAGALVREAITNQSVVTDTQGRYSIAGIRPGLNVMVAVSKVGYLTAASVSRTITADTQIDFELDRRPTYVLSGVINELTPAGLVGIPGVDVYFASFVSNTENAEGSATTDSQGRYRLPGVWGQDALTAIWLIKAGYLIDEDSTCDNCYRKLTIAGDTVLDIQLERLPATANRLRTRGAVFDLVQIRR